MTKYLQAFIFICVLLLKITIIYAQPDTISPSEYINMPVKEMINQKVISVSKYKQTTIDAPASVIIINQKNILQNGYWDLSDLLKDICGVDFIDNARGFGELYSIRGIEGNDRFLVLIDGQKINPPGGTFLSVGNSIPIRFAKRVEIFFGPASPIYGTDAFSGIINIITKDSPINKFAINGNIAYGSRNTINAHLETQYKFKNKLNIYLFARFYKSDGTDLTATDTAYSIISRYTPPQRNKFEQPISDNSVLCKINYKTITLNYFHQGFDEGNALGTAPRGNIFNKEYKWKFATDMFWLSYKKEFKTGGILDFTNTFIQYKISPETQFYKWKKSYSTDTAFSQYMTGLDKSYRSVISYSQNFKDFFELIGGAEYERIWSIPPYANDQVLGKSVKFYGENAKIIKEKLTREEEKYSFFIQSTIRYKNIISLIIGGRYDHSNISEITFNPRIGIICKPHKNTSVKILYGTAFQSPSMFYRYEQWGAAKSCMLSEDEVKKIDPAWALQNQRIKTYEIVFNQIIGENILFTATTYHHELSDLIERSTFSQSVYNKYMSTQTSQVYTTGIRNENIGVQKIYGFTAGGIYNHQNINLSYYYCFTHGHSVKNGKELDLARLATHKMWFSGGVNDFLSYADISLQVKYNGKTNNVNNVIFPNGTQKGYIDASLFLASDKLINKTNIFIKVTNILNQKIIHGGLYSQTESSGYMPTIEQPGIGFFTGIEYTF